jgi:hypothetical protein
MNKLDKMDRNSNIYKNYITFKNLIEKSLNEGLELGDILDGIKKLEVVEIILDKLQGDEPQKIFESINSTGLELSLLQAFYAIKQTTVMPLLFRIFEDYDEGRISEETLVNVLNYLLTYFVRITACEINKNLAKLMKSMYDRVIDGSYDNYYERFVVFLNDLKANNRMPSDKEFEDALIYKPLYKKPICKFVLSVIENSTKEHIDVSNLTIEHILPQKQNAAVWKKEVGDNYGSVYELYLHTLGNLTITGHNSELGTRSFQDKKQIIRDNSKANILNKDVLSANRWNEETIINRAIALSKIPIKEFCYVDKHSDVSEELELEFNVESDMDFSNTKPDGFSFMGEYVKVSNWADLLVKFIGLAYDLNNSLFIELANHDYSLPNATRVYITNDKRKLRKEKQIDNCGIYYESNLSANNIQKYYLVNQTILQLQIVD